MLLPFSPKCNALLELELFCPKKPPFRFSFFCFSYSFSSIFYSVLFGDTDSVFLIKKSSAFIYLVKVRATRWQLRSTRLLSLTDRTGVFVLVPKPPAPLTTWNLSLLGSFVFVFFLLLVVVCLFFVRFACLSRCVALCLVRTHSPLCFSLPFPTIFFAGRPSLDLESLSQAHSCWRKLHDNCRMRWMQLFYSPHHQHHKRDFR